MFRVWTSDVPGAHTSAPENPVISTLVTFASVAPRFVTARFSPIGCPLTTSAGAHRGRGPAPRGFDDVRY
jgi:hypothetical protein